MASRDSLAVLAEQLAIAFQPLDRVLQSPPALRDFLLELGWEFTAAPPELDTLRGPVGRAASFVTNDDLDDGQITELLERVAAALKAITDLSAEITLPADFRAEFPPQLIDFLVVQHLLTMQPRWGFLLMTLGIIRLEEVPEMGNRPPYTRAVFASGEIDDLLSDPIGYFRSGYRWGASDFEGERLIQGLSGLLDAWGFRISEVPVHSQTLAHLGAGDLSPENTSDLSLLLSFIEDVSDPRTFTAGVGLFLLPETGTQKPGFSVLPFATSGFEEPLDIADNLTLLLKGSADIAGGLGVIVRPDEDVQVLAGLESDTPSPASGNLSLQLRLGQGGVPILILGSPDASRFEFDGLSTSIGTRLDGSGKVDAFTEFQLHGGNIVIKPSATERDAFLSKLLPADGLKIGVGLTVGFSTQQGLYFAGSGGFEIALPAHLHLGPVEVLSAKLAVRFGDQGIPVDLAANVATDLSVLRAVVENVGLTANFAFSPGKDGNLGPVNLSLGFKAPTGVGIFLNSGPVTGGGFLSFDTPNRRYSGFMALKVFNVSVGAFGVIDAKLPDGRPGFSFVILISAEFSPIQLGLGFTLNGVGGVIGINRRLEEEGLRQAVRNGSIDHLLFPVNVSARAPQIISDLAALLPAAEGRFVFGPLAKLGWGTPTVIEAKIGIILELPGPRLALLGEIQTLLPKADRGLIVLHMSVAGLLDFPKKLFSLIASLHDSHVGGFPVSGDMAMRMIWGDTPNFALAVGGFHPAFQAPEGFPVLRRVTVDLGLNGNPSLTMQGYLAVTSNTAQVGALIELRAGGAGIRLYGRVQFDAIFIFSPFSFEAGISAEVSVTFHGVGIGVHLSGVLSGPSPWRVAGEVCVSVLFWDACLGFDETFGSAARVELPSVDPWTGTLPPRADGSKDIPGLQDALQEPKNWTPEPPPGALTVVSLTERKDGAIFDPLGSAIVTEKVVPLNVRIQRFGPVRPAGPGLFKLQAAGINGAANAAFAFRDEMFAPAQFFELSDSQKLSSRSYEKRNGAIIVSPNAGNQAAGSLETKPVEYETRILGLPEPEQPKLPDPLSQQQLEGMRNRSASGLFGMRRSGTETYVDPTAPQKFAIKDEFYRLADMGSFRARADLLSGPVPKTEALQALAAHLAANPSDRGSVQAVPTFELTGR